MRTPPFNTIRSDAPAAMPAHRADIRWRRPAFSLLELVIVMAIVTAVSGIGLLRYSRSLSRYRVETACARLIADLRAARTQAVTTSSRRIVVFNAAAATYQILTAAELTANASGTLVSLAGDPYRATMRVVGLAGNQIAFTGRGDVSGAAIIVLTCADAESGVTIEPDSGRVHVVGNGN